VGAGEREAGASAASSLASGLSAAAWVMAAISLAGVVLAFVAIARFRPGEGRGTLEDVMAAAASVVHTVPPVTVSEGASSQLAEDVEAAGDPEAEPPPARHAPTRPPEG
jgi:hypothetical protein